MEQKTTEKDCLLELERVARLVCYSQISGDELAFFRKTLTGPLEQLAKIRKDQFLKKEGKKKYENMGR